MNSSLPGFDLDAFVAATLAEDLGPGGDVTSAAVIPADARFTAVMDSRERNLANQQTFLVTVTRLRDGLTLYVDNAGKLEAAVERNAGMKRSALETVDLLRDAAAKGQAKDRVVPAPERKPPELDRSITKPFEIGI